MTVHRRTVLAALGTAVVTAGCFGRGGPDPGTAPGNETGTDSPTPTETSDGPFADVPCPSFTEADRTICWHTRMEDAPVVLEPEATEYQPVEGNDTVETVRFTLRNRSDRAFGLNPYAWQLQVRDGDRWRHVAPEEHVEPWYTVDPGETFEWVLATREHPSPADDDVVQIVEDIDSGTYALAVDGQLGTEGEDSERVECVTLFDLAVAAENGDATTANGG